MTPGWAATEGDATDGGATDGIADASVGATDAAALGAFFAPLLAASFVVVLPGVADGDVFAVVDAVEAGATCPDVVDVAGDAGDALAGDDAAGAVAIASVGAAAPVEPCTGGFALTSGLGMCVVAANGAGMTGCGNASRMTGDVALSSARVSGNGSGAVAQPDATTAATIADRIVAMGMPDMRDPLIRYGISTSSSSRRRSDGIEPGDERFPDRLERLTQWSADPLEPRLQPMEIGGKFGHM